jgi:GNAT superfamily N-acetyltransferase
LKIIPISMLTFPEWFTLWFDYVQPHITDPNLTLHQTTFERLTSPSSALQGVVAWADRPVGFAHFYFEPSTWDMAEPCYLQDLYVAPQARGQGLSELLVNSVTSIARERGSPALHWRVRESNARAIALYERIAMRTDRLCYSIALR